MAKPWGGECKKTKKIQSKPSLKYRLKTDFTYLIITFLSG
jgi:hypothetical protein